jgi:hypothetical protein
VPNQAQNQGGQQAVPNTEQTTITERGDPVPDNDVKMGRNPSGSAALISSSSTTTRMGWNKYRE